MKVTWLGQAGLFFKTDTITVMIDPYFSNSVGEREIEKNRRVPVKDELLKLHPDVMIFTHNHLDHFDPETAQIYINDESKTTVLAPFSVYERVRCYGRSNNYVLFNRLTEWTEGKIRFKAVRAVHSDPYSIGVIIEAEGKQIYITGDTLYSEEIFADLPDKIDALFLPVNGVGNNMNMIDASRFSNRVNPRLTFPIHIGMFDELSADDFICDNKRILKIYEEIEL